MGTNIRSNMRNSLAVFSYGVLTHDENVELTTIVIIASNKQLKIRRTKK